MRLRVRAVLGALALLTSLAVGDARAETALDKLYLRGGLGVGYSHYWQINYADRNVGGATLEASLLAATRLKPWLYVGAGAGAYIFPAHSGEKDAGGAVTVAPAAGGYVGPALVLLGPRIVRGELLVGIGGGGNSHWGGAIGLVVSPSALFEVWQKGRSHLSVDVRLFYGQWASPDEWSAIRSIVGALAGVSYSFY